MNINQEVRNNYTSKFSSLIDKKIGKAVEASVYDFSCDYANVNETPYLVEQIYESKAEELINVLKDKELTLLKSIKEGELDVSKIGFMRPDELNPDKYNRILKKKETEDFKKKNQATSSSFQCKKCKNNKCQVTQRQTRSADEPATTFVICMECGYEFSFN